MKRSIMLIPTSAGVGLKTVALGVNQFFANNGLVSDIFQPIYQKDQGKKPRYSLSLETAAKHYAKGDIDVFLEKIISNYTKFAKKLDVVVIQGLQVEHDNQYTQQINKKVALALAAEMIIVAAPLSNSYKDMTSRINNTARFFSSRGSSNIIGCIVNKIAPPLKIFANSDQKNTNTGSLKLATKIPLVAKIPWHSAMLRPRVQDILPYLEAKIINEGNLSEARISNVTMCARSVDNVISALTPGNLIITAGDRSDIIIATSIAVANGCKIAGLLLTGGYEPKPELLKLCGRPLEQDLTILVTDHDSFTTTKKLQEMEMHIHPDDTQQQKLAGDFIAEFISKKWLHSWLAESYIPKLTPAAFCHQLSHRASCNLQKIILPEADDPRIVESAILTIKRNLASPILLGNKENITAMAANLGYELPKAIKIINPDDIRDKYVPILVKLRKHKGMTAPVAKEQLSDNILLATLMLHEGEADGLVAGAVATTANTIRPALQIIKTKPGVSIVSSVFFMCLPQQVMVYGDCAINPAPDSDQLAQIAMASAESAATFGIDPKVAMISYATGNSGSGADVTKVAAATAIIKDKLVSYPVDGPLQYDAAINPEVAKKKAPDSKVAGQATVCIFPDLNTGNTTYKAVQRSADVMCIGPMLQGLNKPVNDLSRGASVEDIIFTIVITAIQAQKRI